MRRKPVRIAIFNHKGGVGKTTLTFNIACALADQKKTVLLVDSDPQCNLTSQVIEDSVVNDLLDKSDGPKGNTLWSAVKPIEEGSGNFKSIVPYETPQRGLLLLAGDIKLSRFEGALYDLWTESLNRKIRGLNGTNALGTLVKTCAIDYEVDYVFYDTGPNIGPLNRVILLDCDYFIIPAACDLFSVRALITLGQTLATWVHDWTSIKNTAPDGLQLLGGEPHFLGYIPQNFRVYGDLKAGAFEKFSNTIDKHIYSDVISVLRKENSRLADKAPSDIRLGEVKNYSSLVALAQASGTPLWLARDGNSNLKAAAKDTFLGIAKTIIRKIN